MMLLMKNDIVAGGGGWGMKPGKWSKHKQSWNVSTPTTSRNPCLYKCLSSGQTKQGNRWKSRPLQITIECLFALQRYHPLDLFNSGITFQR